MILVLIGQYQQINSCNYKLVNHALFLYNLKKAENGPILVLIISTIHNKKDFRFNAYEKLFYSCVIPVLDYASRIWGFKRFQSIDNIQNRANQYFMGVHCFASTLAIYALMETPDGYLANSDDG